jgi:hypothetical protein
VINDKSIATAVGAEAERFIEQLSAALLAAHAKPNEDIERLKRAIGEVVGTLEVSLLWPLYKAHPELEPENLKDWENDPQS